MRVSPSLLLPIVAGLLAPSADAALKKYSPRHSIVVTTAQTSPTLFVLFRLKREDPRTGAALIEDGAPPVMRHLDLLTDNGFTVLVPDLSGFIWTNRHWTEGPADDQTAMAGSTAGQIVWGTLSGWASTGQEWCNSEPATICLLAGGNDESTGPALLFSPFYDIGTWYFHGTGFTSVPFVASRYTTGNPGANQQYRVYGAFAPDGTVPALPLTGGIALTAAVVAGGLSALRRR